MSKPLFKLLGLVLLLAFSGNAVGQVTGYWWQVVQEHTGPVDGYDLTGYTTYDLYALVENPDDNVTTVTADGSDCLNDTVSLYFHFPCGLFQHPEAGESAWDMFCFNFDTTPSLEFDSYITIGSECFGEGETVTTSWSCPANIDGFENDPNVDQFDGGDIDVTVGFWGTFGIGTNTVAEQLPGQPGVYGVRIMRITTCGQLCDVDFCFTALVAGIAEGTHICQEDGDCDPCDELEATAEITSPANCFGDVAEITVDAGADPYGPYYYELLDADTGDPIIDSTGSNVFSNLEPGMNYQVVVTNIANCDDTTDVISIPDVPLFTVDLFVDEDILCPGDAGRLCYEITGGTPDYTAVLLDEDNMIYNPVDLCFEDLPCGLYALGVEDANGCQAGDTASVSCVDLMTFDIEVNDLACFEDASGSLLGTVTGGTGEMTAVWNTDPETTITGTGPLDISIADLAIGNYEVTVTDANGCQVSEDYDLIQPELLELTLEATDVSCALLCDGSITGTATGGTGDYIFECGDSMTDLCAGEYTCTVTDENGCTAEGMVEIIEPNPISFDVEFEMVSCNGADDASVTISNIVGGTGDIDISISPLAGTIVNNLPESISITDLPAQVYTVEITDNDGQCTIEQEIIITEPDALVGDVVVTGVLCSGDDNGTVAVSSTGGSGGDVICDGFPEGPQVLPYEFTGLESGEYNITLTDTSGCTWESTVEIMDAAQLTLTLNSVTDVSCGGYCDGALDATSTGGTSPISWFIDGSPTFYPSGLIGLCASDLPQTLSVVDANGCSVDTTFVILEPEPIDALFLIDQTTCTGMCDGNATVTLIGGTAPLDIDWEDNNIEFEDMCEGEYPFIVTDAANCVLYDTLVMTAEIESDIMYEIFTTPVTCWNEDDGTATIALTGGNEPITYTWNDPDNQTTPVVVGLTNDIYQVVIEDAAGCVITENVVIEMNIGCLFIADALSPNGDGYNDDWVVGGLEYFPESKVQVFNRWGQLLFESTGYPTRWDGTYDGKKLPMADYYYVIVYDTQKDPILGTVTIKY